MVVLAVGQPWKVGSQSLVAADNVMAGCWYIVVAGQCSGQEWKGAGHAGRGMRRELSLVPGPVQGVMHMVGVRYPESKGRSSQPPAYCRGFDVAAWQGQRICMFLLHLEGLRRVLEGWGGRLVGAVVGRGMLLLSALSSLALREGSIQFVQVGISNLISCW